MIPASSLGRKGQPPCFSSTEKIEMTPADLAHPQPLSAVEARLSGLGKFSDRHLWDSH